MPIMDLSLPPPILPFGLPKITGASLNCIVFYFLVELKSVAF